MTNFRRLHIKKSSGVRSGALGGHLAIIHSSMKLVYTNPYGAQVRPSYGPLISSYTFLSLWDNMVQLDSKVNTMLYQFKLNANTFKLYYYANKNVWYVNVTKTVSMDS
jgi:hypothetical protein